MWENFESGELEAKPGAVSCSSVINCWAKSRQKGGAERAEHALREMQDRCKAGDEVPKPNDISCSSAINAFAKTEQAEKAEALLKEMHHAFVNGHEFLKPNVRSFKAALDARSKSASLEAAQQAKQILATMCQHFDSGKLNTKPNFVCCTTAICCWAKARQHGAQNKLNRFSVRCKIDTKLVTKF
jgi:pentatricopeptide repeat protein